MIVIEYDSTDGYPTFYVYDEGEYVGYSYGDSLYFCTHFNMKDQLRILNDLVKMVEEKPLTRENYEV